MPRTISTFLLLVFLTDAVGSCLFMLARKASLKMEMREWLSSSEPDKNLKRITTDPVSFNQIKWVERQREFYHQGVLHDVSKITKHADGTVTIYCIADEKESSLLQWFGDVFMGSADDEESKRSVAGVFVFLFKLMIVPGMHVHDLQSSSDQSSFAYTTMHMMPQSTACWQPPENAQHRHTA